MVRQAAALNSILKGMNCGTANQAASERPEASIMPNGMEIRQPMIMPKKIAPSFMTPLAKLESAKTMARVTRPTNQLWTEPKIGEPAPPAMYLMAVGYSETPMVKITVPVTSGGKSLRTFLKNRPNRMATTPPTSSAPSRVPKPKSKPMAWNAGRKANETPVMMGMLEPTRPKSGNCWSSVSSAVRRSATWMIACSCSGVKLQVEAIIIAGAIAPAKHASTCCRDVGNRSFMGGIPSRWKSLGEPMASSF